MKREISNNLKTEKIIDSMSKETIVSLSFPNEISIELVQANELRHYELFQWLVILVAPIAVGYWTAYLLDKKNSLLWASIIFSLISILFIGIAFFYRKKVFHGSIKKITKITEFK